MLMDKVWPLMSVFPNCVPVCKVFLSNSLPYRYTQQIRQHRTTCAKRFVTDFRRHAKCLESKAKHAMQLSYFFLTYKIDVRNLDWRHVLKEQEARL
ncbi:unnamed protein product [Amoebophrya sp. A25]|nr:unnamed protein product [Amoebophrya sp. A25]|eukprot:GSA25T00018078001.1